MAQLLISPEARCGIEVLRTEASVVMAVLDSDCAIDLISHPTSWASVGPQHEGGRRIFNFDEMWRPVFRHGPQGVEPYPLLEATRKFIRGVYSAPVGFKGGALDALIDLLPPGDVHVFAPGLGFVGRFCSVDDARMIAASMKLDVPIIFQSPEELLNLARPHLLEVAAWLDEEFRVPQKPTIKTAQEIFEMAKKAAKKKVAKVAKAEAAQRRADGPVQIARAIFEKMKDAPSADIIAACEKAGVNRGTASTQLGRWRKANGIVVKRGGARTKGQASAPAAAPKAPAKKAKKKGAKGDKKTEAKPNPSLPKAPKGAKRHKPTPAASSATPPASALSTKGENGAQSTPATPTSPTPSKKGNAASASTGSDTAPTASISGGADSQAPASGGAEASK